MVASGYFTLRIITKGEDTVIVPDLVGKYVVDVLGILSDLGLNAKIEESEYNINYPKDHVTSQDPEPGAEIKKGRSIRLILSKGNKEVITPNLKGLTSQQARIILEENGLCLGGLSYSSSDNMKKNEVISQTVIPGKVTSQGKCIDLLISTGKSPKAIIMPDLTGLPLDDAILAVEINNLVLGDVSEAFHADQPLGIITAQKPLSGYRITEGSVVYLERNKKEPLGKSSSASGNMSRADTLFRYRLKNGFIKRHIRLRLDAFGVSCDLLDAYEKPGKEIWAIIPKEENASITLYINDEQVKKSVYSAW